MLHIYTISCHGKYSILRCARGLMMYIYLFLFGVLRLSLNDGLVLVFFEDVCEFGDGDFGIVLFVVIKCQQGDEMTLLVEDKGCRGRDGEKEEDEDYEDTFWTGLFNGYGGGLQRCECRSVLQNLCLCQLQLGCHLRVCMVL